VDLNMICGVVSRVFAETDAARLAWPDPHSGREPADEEYSRCLDPGKYQIIGARADAWLRALAELSLATVTPAGDLDAGWRSGPPRGAPVTRARWARPDLPGTIALLVCWRGFGSVLDNLVTLGAGEPAVEIATLPDCGCDACDDGSAGLIETFDDRVLDVISGEFVHIATQHGTVQGRRNGWQASGFGGRRELIKQVLSDARAGRSAHPMVRGARWW
jgi:hypothetical protein